MKYGLVIFAGKIENYFKFANELGVNHLEIDLFAREQKIDMFDPRRIKKIKKLAHDHGISLSLHLPYCLNPASLVPDLYQASLGYFKQGLALAGELEARWVTAHPGYYQGLAAWDWMRCEAMTTLKVFLGDILPSCGSLKIPLVIENNTSLPVNGQFFNLGSCAEDFQDLFNSFPSPYLQMCLDTGHANIAEGVMPYLERFFDKIVNMHIHDNQGEVDEHLPPGDGTIEWSPVLEFLVKNEYRGVLNIELLNDDDKKSACEFVRIGCQDTGRPRGKIAL